MEVRVLDSDSIDFSDMRRLLEQAFAFRSESKVKVEIPTSKSLEFKYQTLNKDSRLAAVFHNDEIVAMNGLIPLEIRRSGVDCIGWMSCDSATHPDFQGQGLFRKCVTSLEDSLPPGTLIFGFPNSNSMPGFKKMGWLNLGEIDLYFSPQLPGGKKSISIRRVEMESFTSPGSFTNGIVKSDSYLNWRYSHHRGAYNLHKISDKDFSFTTITRDILIMGKKITMILEVMSDQKMFSGVHLRKICEEQGTVGLLVAPEMFTGIQLGKSGFFRVPKFLVSRRIHLAGKMTGEVGSSLPIPNSWQLSLGDFDAI
jgi:hypothetical protein